MRIAFFTFITVIFFHPIFCQQTPKLVVGIVVDQMRADYMARFSSRFGKDGFNRFINSGFQYKNVHYNYSFTKTACGHASLYTGAVPAVHGVVGNDWYHKKWQRKVNCVEDTSVVAVGAMTNNGNRSPFNLKAATITDELMLFNQFRSKVLSLSLKDRGAILPGGHLGKAFWLDKQSGNFITSSFYSNHLPIWVINFNKKRAIDTYMKSTWSTLYDINTYVASSPDMELSEKPFDGEMSGFPYDLSKLKHDFENVFKSPFGNTLLMDFISEGIKAEALGKDDVTDFLAISFSSTDYIGHDTGPYAIEVEDVYLRLDMELARLFSLLDEEVGIGNYVVFLTADHGVAPNPEYLMSQQMPAGFFDIKKHLKDLEAALTSKFGEGPWVEYRINRQFYLDKKRIKSSGVDAAELKSFIKHWMLQLDGVLNVFTDDDIRLFSINDMGIEGHLARSFNQKTCGEITWVLMPGWLEPSVGDATSHKSSFNYDTHVPLLWYGAGIPKGVSYEYHTVTQVAATLSFMLDITLPSAAEKIPLIELLEK